VIRIPLVDAKVAENEVRVLKELWGEGAHVNIVSVFTIGGLFNDEAVFIDMELCDLNLAEYIVCSKPRDSVPTFFIVDQPPPVKARQVWNVMIQITTGIKYLHLKHIVHRDLKPANGTTVYIVFAIL
jgi:serine/threonine protein kinase